MTGQPLINADRMYKIGEWGKANNDFSEIFGISMRQFYDGQPTVVFQKICIDIFRFDDYLHKLYGDYEDGGDSMETIILKHYGKRGLEIINKLT